MGTVKDGEVTNDIVNSSFNLLGIPKDSTCERFDTGGKLLPFDWPCEMEANFSKTFLAGSDKV